MSKPTLLQMIHEITEAGDTVTFGGTPMVRIVYHDRNAFVTVWWGNRRDIAAAPYMYSGSHGAGLRTAYDTWKRDHLDRESSDH